jgi:hypothetical protein
MSLHIGHFCPCASCCCELSFGLNNEAHLHLGSQLLPNFPGLVIRREAAYRDAWKSAFNETSPPFRPAAMARNILQERQHLACYTGWVATSWTSRIPAREDHLLAQASTLVRERRPVKTPTTYAGWPMRRRLLTLVCLLTLLVFGNAAGQPARTSDEVELKKLSLEERRLKLDTDRFVFDQKKYDRDRGLEWGKAWAAIGSVLVTLGVGLAAYIFQVRTRKRDEALQFQLKAAEIVMDARDTNQARRKAEFLAKLFPGRLDLLEIALKAQSFPFFGRSQETREDLLRVLAQYPESRSDIIHAWEILFPWDSTDSKWAAKSDDEKNAYRWFDELKRDKSLNQNRLAAVAAAEPR